MGRRIQAIRNWHAHAYMSTVPVLSPRAAGAALMVSPKLVVTQGFNKLFRRVEDDPDDVASPSVGTNGFVTNPDYEEVVLAVSDDIDIVLRNFNLGVRIGDLSPLEQLTLVAEGIQDTHFRDLSIPLYRPV